MKDCLKKAQIIQKETIAHRRYLHKRAEVGFDVPLTTAYIHDTLKGWGYQPKQLKKGGVIAEIGQKDRGRAGFILLRADMDGLRIKEESGLPYASKNGNMHACGHDFHTAALLSAARILKEEKLSRPVRLLFQPAEEILEGAKYAVDNGACDKVDAAFTLHVSSGADIPVGKMIFSGAGALAPSADTFEIEVAGKGCHGATPYQGVDALACAIAISQALTGVIAKEIPIGDGLLTVGKLEGATAANVLTGEVRLGGSCRAFNETVRTFIKQRIVRIAKGIAAAYRAKAKVRFFGGCPCLMQDKRLLDRTLRTFRAEFGTQVISLANEARIRKIGASEDFAYISAVVPSLLVSVSAAQKGGGYPLHHPKVAFDEKALSACVAAYLAFAMQKF